MVASRHPRTGSTHEDTASPTVGDELAGPTFASRLAHYECDLAISAPRAEWTVEGDEIDLWGVRQSLPADLGARLAVCEVERAPREVAVQVAPQARTTPVRPLLSSLQLPDSVETGLYEKEHGG